MTRAERLFFELFEALPRQGPGSRECTARALALCRDLPPVPRIIDLGCGTGAQALDLAELSQGSVIAIDNHAPFIELLQRRAAERGLTDRVRGRVADMADPGLSPASFDLAWSEGAFYNIGIANALRICHELLRPGACVAFSDAVWRNEDPPPEIEAMFAQEYPAMGRVGDVTAIIEQGDFELLGHFSLPEEAWWADFYMPMLHQLAKMREKYAHDAEALAMLDQLAVEPEMHRRNARYYAYEFFILSTGRAT